LCSFDYNTVAFFVHRYFDGFFCSPMCANILMVAPFSLLLFENHYIDCLVEI
jgi:hypothetical protein